MLPSPPWWHRSWYVPARRSAECSRPRCRTPSCPRYFPQRVCRCFQRYAERTDHQEEHRRVSPADNANPRSPRWPCGAPDLWLPKPRACCDAPCQQQEHPPRSARFPLSGSAGPTFDEGSTTDTSLGDHHEWSWTIVYVAKSDQLASSRVKHPWAHMDSNGFIWRQLRPPNSNSLSLNHLHQILMLFMLHCNIVHGYFSHSSHAASDLGATIPSWDVRMVPSAMDGGSDKPDDNSSAWRGDWPRNSTRPVSRW